MDSLHYDPLDYYKQNLEQKHKGNIEELFEQLTKTSGVDIEKNRKTVAEYKTGLKAVEKMKNRSFWLCFLRVVMFVLAAAALILGIVFFNTGWYIPTICFALAVILPVLVFVFLNKKIKNLNSRLEAENERAKRLYGEALSQMSSLNALFNEKMTLQLFEKTNPRFKFESNFSSELSDELRQNCDMPYFNDNEDFSVIDALSGRYNKNPFVYLRRLVCKMGMEIYHGYKVISWTETYRDSKGNRRTRTRTQTLHAQVSKPKPFYHTDTLLYFGAQGAPDLCFSREGKNINLKSDGAIERFVKKGEKQNKKRAQKAIADGGGFTAMTNTEFDSLFNATDRDNEVQFRLMFTPLAQTSMVELILSDDTFGDDFDFYKFKRLNIVKSDHAQVWNMDTSPENYRSYSYDESKSKFENFNNAYFKSVYFDFAPLLAIPVYQEDVKVMKSDVKGTGQVFADEEYELMANAIGAKNFAHPATQSSTILKACYDKTVNGEEQITVKAYSYSTIKRFDVVMVLGGDGRMHSVTVPWLEYIPISQTSTMYSRTGAEEKEEKNITSKIRNKIHAYINKYGK